MNELALYFEQNEVAIEGFARYLGDLRRAIDEQDGEQIAFNLEMLKGLYHLLEGNHVNIVNLVKRDRPDLAKFFGG